MKIGLIDVDGCNFPNLAIMKISAYHKRHGDSVEWYSPLLSGHLDKVYMSKVFSFTEDYEYFIDADEIDKGGSGYCIKYENGKEIFDSALNKELPEDVEHIFPDYSLYPKYTRDRAFGFLTRGCPRSCPFCIVSKKESKQSNKVADLSEFWNGQSNIELLDPNLLACNDADELLQQIVESKTNVNFNQGLDIRFIDEKRASLINRIKLEEIHFAWDNINDKDILPGLKKYARIATRKPHGHFATVYVLTNFNSDIKDDLERIYTLRALNYDPYVMIYDKEHAPREITKLQRWCNNKFIFNTCDRFEEYKG